MKPIEIHIEGYKITIAEDDGKENKITVDKFTIPAIPVQDHKIEAKPYMPIQDDWYRTPPSWWQNPPMWWEKPYCTCSDNDPNVVKGTTTAGSMYITATNPPIYNTAMSSTKDGIVTKIMKGTYDGIQSKTADSES